MPFENEHTISFFVPESVFVFLSSLNDSLLSKIIFFKSCKKISIKSKKYCLQKITVNAGFGQARNNLKKNCKKLL